MSSVEEFNTQRPHEALDMNRPADVFVQPTRKHPTFLPDPDYSTYDDVLRVGTQGLIHFPGRRQVHLTKALAGQLVGIRGKVTIAGSCPSCTSTWATSNPAATTSPQ
jgi:putative transposase